MKTVINIKTDKKVKESVRNKEVHSTIVPRMSSELEEFLGYVEEDIKKKRNFSPAFSSGEEMDQYLSSL